MGGFQLGLNSNIIMERTTLVTALFLIYQHQCSATSSTVGPMQLFYNDSSTNYIFAMDIDLQDDSFIIMTSYYSVFRTNGSTVINIVGSLRPGYAEGVGTAALFNYIKGIAQLSETLMVVTDHANHCLRSIDRVTRLTSVFAGNCTVRGGAESQDGFSFPWGLLRFEDTLYVTDYSNHAVRCIDIYTKKVTTIVRDTVRLEYPRFLLLDEQRNIIVSTYHSGLVRVNTTSGEIKQLTRVGIGYIDGALEDALFNNIQGIAWFTRNQLLLADHWNSRIRLLDLEQNTTSTVCTAADDSAADGAADCRFRGIFSLLYNSGTLYAGLAGTVRMTHEPDIDECKLRRSVCHNQARCTNSLGSFSCKCEAGFSGNGYVCEDIDECLSDNGGCTHAKCRNTYGSYTCECQNGSGTQESSAEILLWSVMSSLALTGCSRWW